MQIADFSKRVMLVALIAVCTSQPAFATSGDERTPRALESASITDPIGDQGPGTEYHADITGLGIAYDGQNVTLRMKVDDIVEPGAGWTDSDIIDWELDTNGDGVRNFVVAAVIFYEEAYADVLVLKADFITELCRVGLDLDGLEYITTFPASCIGRPASIRINGNTLFAPDSKDSAPDSGFCCTVTRTITQGYWLVGTDGGIFSYGKANFYGSTGAITLNKPIVGMTPTPSGLGYWFVASDGGIFSYGDAAFYGSTGAISLNKPIVGMAATPSGLGYWLVASDGGIFAFGDAAFYGSTGAITLNKPIVGMTPTPSGLGYWFVASDGGIFSYGDAAFYGSTGAISLNKPIVGMAATPSGLGYWFVASDGGIFSYGDAAFYGTASPPSGSSIVGMEVTMSGTGYRLVASNGNIDFFGDAENEGDLESAPAKPIVGIASI